MKKILLNLLILISLCVQSQVKHSIRDLQQGDVIGLKITVPAENANLSSIWDFEHGYKIDIDFRVLSLEKDSIRMIVRPTRLFVLFDNPTSNNSFAYFDTNFYTYYDYKPWFFLFEDNSVVASINTNDWGTEINYKEKTSSIDHIEEKKSTGRSNKDWHTQALNIPKGLKVINNINEPITDIYPDFDKIVKESLRAFAEKWDEEYKEGKMMPWMLDLRDSLKSDSNSPVFVQVTSASFDLLPNTSIIYQPSKEMPENSVFLKIGNEKILPIKKESNSYLFSFFLPSPKRAYINDLTLDITPNDSLIVKRNISTGNYEFSGIGAANSSFINKIIPLYNGEFPNIEGDANDPAFLENIKRNFIKNEEFFRSTLTQYIDEMNDYWVKSAKLSFDYWYANERFKLCDKVLERLDLERLPMLKQYLKDNPDKLKEFNKYYNLNELNEFRDEISIPWQNEHFTNVFPFCDYLYQPYTYNNFIKDFFVYKAKETNNTIMTGMNYLQSDLSSYYFVKTVFSGYPRSYLNSETLKDLMINFHLDKHKREYEDFFKNKHDPEIRESIVELHEQLMKIEPGSNIKDLKLDVEKYIPLKNKADRYIILLVGDSIGFNYVLNDQIRDIQSIYRDMDKEIVKAGLKDKVELCFITNEHYKAALDSVPEIQEKIIFVPDKIIEDYKDKVIIKKRCFLILRSNGFILDRSYDSSTYSRYPNSKFVLEVIHKDIKEQENKDTASGRVLTIIVSIILSGLITFFLVRYIILRREKLKRHIQELELKAIRAQINPHFTFNALGSIQNLISQKKDKEANEYLVNFAKLLRMVLSTSEKKLIPLSEEIELLNLYLHLEQLRVPFDYAIDVDNDIDVDNEEIPGMLIQPIVENAVKHGIVPKGGGNINIRFKMENQMLLVDIIDSGSGFTDTDVETNKGFGLKSVQERLYLLNKERHINIDFKVENIIKDGVIVGAKVSLYIPI